MIKVDSLVKQYPAAAAPTLRGVSFMIDEGAIGAILGGSGAGKTTLLRCLTGLEAFDSGFIELDGVVVRATSNGDARRARNEARLLLRSRVGLVFQSHELFPHLSVLDNVTLAPIKVMNVPREEARGRALEILADLGLGEKVEAYPDHLSGGQRQRVAIARALAMEPRVLLYDEPTSALDPKLKREVGEVIRRVAGTGVTQIVVTHDIDLARDATDSVFVLHQGEIVETGESRAVLEDPRDPATRKLLGLAATA